MSDFAHLACGIRLAFSECMSTERIKTCLILTLIGYAVLVTYHLVKAEVKAFRYEQAFEQTRGQIEALYRTKGFKINPAFRCYDMKRYTGLIERE